MTRAAAFLAILVLFAGCDKPKKQVVYVPPARTPLSIPAPFEEQRFDFEAWKEAEWTPTGTWHTREVDDAPSGKCVLERDATEASGSAPAVLWQGDEFADVQVSMMIRFMGDSSEAEGGIVLRAAEGMYYAACVNARGRVGVSGCAKGTLDYVGAGNAPALSVGKWHSLTVVAIGDQVQCQLDGTVQAMGRDGRFKKGRIGLWWMRGNTVQVDDLVIRTRSTATETFEGLDWEGVPAQARATFFGWVNREMCACGSGKTLARCRKAGCAEALERGREVLEQCESQ